MELRSSIWWWAALGLAQACTGGEKGTSNGDVARTAQGLPPVIAASSVAYRETTVMSGGTISGTVSVEGTAPAPQVAQVTSDQSACADGLADESSVSSGRVANAVVWLEGVAEGKRRSRIRRYEVNQQRCALDPRVQALEAPGTINVHSHDVVPHRTRFIAHPAGTVLSVARAVDAGQVVPDERAVARAGLVEIRCELHPWTRGWLAVFDHPYFAMSTGDGSFSIDEVPAGTYTLVVWHERGTRTTQQITVAAGQTVTAELRIKLQ